MVRAATRRLAAAAADAAAASVGCLDPAAGALTPMATAAIAAATVAAPSASAWSLLRGRAPAAHLGWWRRRCYSAEAAAAAAAAASATSSAAAPPPPDTSREFIPLNGAPLLARTPPRPSAATGPSSSSPSSSSAAAAARRAAAAAALDLRAPPSRFPYARALRRRIVYHAGPTNSGKTYSALQALKAAPRGVYCGPLRLLAMEVYERLNAGDGVRCSLVTGQEVLRVPGAGHVACTVEMAALHAHADVAVLDEIQLLGDEQRGAAWTRALLGLPANELHVCGDPSAVGLVAALAAACGDAFELRVYERFAPLQIDAGGLPNGLADVQPGDCVVAFSRRAIFEARRQVEALTGRRAAVVYGALPAETRREQARAFNDPSEGTAQVLVASDAVGLGLNFNIRRVVFHAMTKTITTTTAGNKGNEGKEGKGGKGRRSEGEGGRAAGGGGGGGKEDDSDSTAATSDRPSRGDRPARAPRPVRITVPVPVTLVKQIAGRAGRRNSPWPDGAATTLNPKDLPALRKALASPLAALRTPRAGLAPDAEALEAAALRCGGEGARLDRVLELWQREVSLDGKRGRYFLCDASQLMTIARAVGALGSAGGGNGGGGGGGGGGSASALAPAAPLSLADRFTLAAAPVDTADPRCLAAFMRFARDLAAGGPVRAPFRWAAEGEVVRAPSVDELAARAAAAERRRRGSRDGQEEEEEEEQDEDGAPRRARARRLRPPRPPRFPVGGVFLSADPSADDGAPPLRLPTIPPRSVLEMADLEAAHKVLSLWLWLSHRFDAHLFPARGAVADAAARLCAWLSDGLRATSELAATQDQQQLLLLEGRAGAEADDEGGGDDDDDEEEDGGSKRRRQGRRQRGRFDGDDASAAVGPGGELSMYDWRRRQVWRLLGPRGAWLGVRGGIAYTGDDEGQDRRRRHEAKRAAKKRGGEQQAAAAAAGGPSCPAAAAAAADDDALRFAHPPVPADAAALLSSSGGGLAGGGGGALAAAALLPRRAAGSAARAPRPSAAAAEGAAAGGRAAAALPAASSSAAAAHPHAWLIALGDTDPLAALMHSSEWDPSMSRFLGPREHGRLVIPPPPAAK
jgi:hypothetical protein